MNMMLDVKGFPALPLDYPQMYRQYLASLYQLSAKWSPDSLAGLAPPSCSSPMNIRKNQGLWSPAKLLEAESSESGEDLGSGRFLEHSTHKLFGYFLCLSQINFIS